MIVKNKLAKEKLELTLSEFKIRFKKDIKTALESFMRTENTKPYFRQKLTESDFYFDLRWNFNNYSNSVWYIERL